MKLCAAARGIGFNIDGKGGTGVRYDNSEQRIGMTDPKTIQEALDDLASPSTPDKQRWVLLAFILRQFMLAQGVDLNFEVNP